MLTPQSTTNVHGRSITRKEEPASSKENTSLTHQVTTGNYLKSMANNKDISVLIVDDNDTTRATLRVILRSENYNVIGEATDGDFALEMVSRLRPNIILLDVIMPKVSGLEALKGIRLISSEVSILMVTGNRDHETVTEAVIAGISGYIIKPFNTKQVLDTVQKVAEQVRAAKLAATSPALASNN